MTRTLGDVFTGIGYTTSLSQDRRADSSLTYLLGALFICLLDLIWQRGGRLYRFFCWPRTSRLSRLGHQPIHERLQSETKRK
jgi:hypothetical protein